MTPKTWFITGCSRGFGRIWALAALERGDRVAATARDVESIQELADTYPQSALLLPLDVTDPDAVKKAVQDAYDHFGRLDVVVNNAGFALIGAVEEVDVDDVRALFETNFFGALAVIQAALPIMRSQGGGHLLSVSSLAGLIGEPALGMYNATKWALEGMSEALSLEVGDLGIKVTIVEPGPYATEFGGQDSLRTSAKLPAYTEARRQLLTSYGRDEVGSPEATTQAIFAVVDAEDPPLRLTLGRVVRPRARKRYEARLATWDAWAQESDLAHGGG